MCKWISVDDWMPMNAWLEENGYWTHSVLACSSLHGPKQVEPIAVMTRSLGYTHWMPIMPPVWMLIAQPAGAETIDVNNPPSGGSAVTPSLKGHGDLVTKVDAYLLGVNTMLKAVEMLAKTVRGESPHD